MRHGDGIPVAPEHDPVRDPVGDPFAGAAGTPEVLGDDPDRAPADPMTLAAAWAAEVAHRAPLESVLATVAADGAPEARTVLVSTLDADGFAVHTQESSAKALALTADPRAALVIRLAEVGRQISVQADVTRQSPEGAAAAYAARSPYLKALAWLNDPAYASLPADERQRRWAAFDVDRDGAYPPPSWAGFVLRPWRVAFWATSTTMASRRLEYVRDGGAPSGWRRALLPG